ncbi:MAG: 16S rRNA (adenine(1518)-N(6)/adenine(1519)-N(6))-dimethyltransferase RsmA [Clostridia bacterium]|nr:16S rRNA (adenine(1518)-N(6)/adenine(1519)-N(6))-dimethyltransferase RsmA [Clostridia bacterium]
MEHYAGSQKNSRKSDQHFRFLKSLGQNFLQDEEVIGKILDGSDIGPEDLVIEVGPGSGALTVEAARRAGRLVAVELDSRLIPVLKAALVNADNAKIINGDILKTDIAALIRDNRGTGKVRIIGNLPYYITTPIIMKFLEEGESVDTITVMMQKEVADRLTAAPGTKECGAITLETGYFAEVSRVCDVPKEAFMPMPKVESAVLRLDVRKEPPVQVPDRKFLFEVIKAGFTLRRKTLRNSLMTLGGFTKDQIEQALGSTGIDPARRGETLSLQEYADLSNALRELKEG